MSLRVHIHDGYAVEAGSALDLHWHVCLWCQLHCERTGGIMRCHVEPDTAPSVPPGEEE